MRGVNGVGDGGMGAIATDPHQHRALPDGELAVAVEVGGSAARAAGDPQQLEWGAPCTTESASVAVRGGAGV